jgi:hypothetical protein
MASEVISPTEEMASRLKVYRAFEDTAVGGKVLGACRVEEGGLAVWVNAQKGANVVPQL